jgi:hypothetical protein
MPLGLAYREWLLGLARREADAGCPRLLAMKSERALYFADLTQTWDAERRYNLMCARTKALFTGNYGYPPVPVTAEEAAADALWQPPRPYQRSLIPTPEEARARDREKGEWDGTYKIDKPMLKRRLHRAMCDRFGKPKDRSYYYVSQAGELTVTSVLDFGVRFGQFGYMQWIQSPRRKRLLWSGGILELLGWSQSRWGRLTNDDIPATVELVVRLCEEFVEAVPEMWARSGLANQPLPEG